MLMRVCLTVELRGIILWCMVISLAGLYLLFDFGRRINLIVVELSASRDVRYRHMSICYQPDVVLI